MWRVATVGGVVVRETVETTDVWGRAEFGLARLSVLRSRLRSAVFSILFDDCNFVQSFNAQKVFMNRQAIRLGLAAVAMFYVVIGGMWAVNYFPLQKLLSQSEVQRAYVEKHGSEKWYDSPEYKRADEYQTLYALTHPDIFVTDRKIHLYQSLLLWGTVAIVVGGAVLALTRGKGPASAQPSGGGSDDPKP